MGAKRKKKKAPGKRKPVAGRNAHSAPGKSSRETFDAVAVVAGTGVQTGSWDPIFRAFQTLGCPGVTCPDTANTALAAVVQNRRLAHVAMPDGGPTPSRKDVDAAYSGVVSQIRKELRTAQDEGNIKLRETFEPTWDRAIGQFTSARTRGLGAYTTNWDDVFVTKMMESWQTDVDPANFHLHGGLHAQGDLLLPSETAIEPYRPQDSEHARRLLDRRKMLLQTVASVELLVLWGIGLAPLDAELMQALTIGLWSEGARVRQINIVNPDHRNVARRLMAIAPSGVNRPRPLLVGWESGEMCKYEWSS